MSQLNAQMRLWELRSYKKGDIDVEGLGQRQHKFSQPPTTEAKGDQILVARFAKLSTGRLRTVLQLYGLDPAAVDNTSQDTPQRDFAFALREALKASLANKADDLWHRYRTAPSVACQLGVLEDFGDFLFAGGALEEAFEVYCCALHCLLENNDLPESRLTYLIIKTASSATSHEQEEIRFELLEHCALFQAITGKLVGSHLDALQTEFMSKSRTINDTSRSLEPTLAVEDLPELYEWARRSLRCGLGYFTKSLCTGQSFRDLRPFAGKQMQKILYSYFWQEWYLGYKSRTIQLGPSLRSCKVLLALSCSMVEVLAKSKLLQGLLEDRNPLSMTSIKYLQDVLVDVLTHSFPRASAELDERLLEVYRCCPSPKSQSTASQTASSLLGTLDLAVGKQLPRHRIYEKCECVPQLDSEDTDDDAMLQRSAPSALRRSASAVEHHGTMSQSLYLCSSSIYSSMRSMLSMASRINRKATSSALASLSQVSAKSMSMSISGSFGFGRVTGMGSASGPIRRIGMVAEGEEDTYSERESAIVEERPEFSKALSEAMDIDNVDFIFQI